VKYCSICSGCVEDAVFVCDGDFVCEVVFRDISGMSMVFCGYMSMVFVFDGVCAIRTLLGGY